MTRFIQIIDGLTRLSAAIAALLLAVIVASYSFEVVSRYFFDAPTLWASDLVGFLFCWMIFLVMPEVTRTHGHVSITILNERLSGPVRLRVGQGLMLVGALVCFATAGISASENMRQIVQSITTVSVYPLPKWSIAAAMTFGFAFSGLQFLFAAVRHERTQTDRIEGFA